MLSYEHNCSNCRTNFLVHPEQSEYTQAVMAVALGNPPVMQTATCKCGYSTRSTATVDDNEPICFTFLDRARAKYFKYRSTQTDPLISWFMARGIIRILPLPLHQD